MQWCLGKIDETWWNSTGMRPYVDPRPGSVSSQPSQPQSLSVILASRVQYPAPIHLGSRHPWRSCEGIPTRFQHGTSNYNLILLYNLLQSIIYNLLCILLLSLTLHLLYLLTLVLAPSKTERKKRHSWATAVTPKTMASRIVFGATKNTHQVVLRSHSAPVNNSILLKNHEKPMMIYHDMIHY